MFHLEQMKLSFGLGCHVSALIKRDRFLGATGTFLEIVDVRCMNSIIFNSE